jgi:hypothetical protein
MIKLYGGAKSRASIVRWYLAELGVPSLADRPASKVGF